MFNYLKILNMKKILVLLAVLLKCLTGFCDNPPSLNTLADEINETCPISWEYECTITSISYTGSTVSIKMDYNNKKGDFFTTFRDEARANKEEWLRSMYKISPQWKDLLNESLAKEITLTLIIYSTQGGLQGGFSLKVFLEQIQKVKEMLDKEE